MPNWVNNELIITAEPEVINKIVAQVSAPFERRYYDHFKDETRTERIEKPFSFWNIVKPTDLEAYEDAKGKSQDGPDHWYQWNIRNWGTKWDVNDVYGGTIRDDGKTISYAFDTAWSPPVDAIDKLANQYPSAQLTLNWTEEQGFGGTIEWEDGEGVETDSYEYKCWECDERFQSYEEAKFDEESGEHLCKDKEEVNA
jgi:hypothetical protein